VKADDLDDISDYAQELIYPTLIELCDLSDNPEVEGVSVVPLLRNPDSEWLHPAVTTLYQNNHSVRTKHWRYISYADGSEETL
jgi:choline-sulfatase